MTRLLCLGLVISLANSGPVRAQPKETPKYFTNSAGMKFVWIAPGNFTMGSPPDEKGRHELEKQHTVKVTKGFYMGVYAVTQEQWREVFHTPGYVKPAEGFDLGNPSRFLHDVKLPVENVSWNDCQGFIKKLRQKDKRPYRLPTEAEWEYACRAGTNTPFHFQEASGTLQANFARPAVPVKGKKAVHLGTMPVGSFPPNAWGLHDMHGNVAQWCQDRFGPYDDNAVDPQGPQEGGSRILRGGSWNDAPARGRSAARAWDSPDNRGRGTFGFRLCFFPE